MSTRLNQLSPGEITDIVNLSASLHTNFITVDTHWDYPGYLQEWVNAVRAVHLHVWFRSHPSQWDDDTGATSIMTPADYEVAEQTFIKDNAMLFQPGDIFDPCPESEGARYWVSKYGDKWKYNAPNKATRALNAFIRDNTDVANKAFQQAGVSGFITTIRSTSAFFAQHATLLEPATVKKFQRITLDSYPDASTTDPTIAAQSRVEELQTIENLWHVPIVLGEMGYSNEIAVDAKTQEQVLKVELNSIARLPYVVGVNYWVGAGSDSAGGYTYIIAKHGEQWNLRPAASDLSTFYEAKLCVRNSYPQSSQQAHRQTDDARGVSLFSEGLNCCRSAGKPGRNRLSFACNRCIRKSFLCWDLPLNNSIFFRLKLRNVDFGCTKMQFHTRGKKLLEMWCAGSG